jgi:hypothetical protein
MHPQPRVRFVVLVCTRVFTAEAPEHPAFPTRWFTPYIAHRQLSACFGAPGPHDFAVRIRHARPTCHPRPPHPHLTYRDDRPKRPSSSRQDAREHRCDLPDGASADACDRLARRAICAWRACGNCPSGKSVRQHSGPSRRSYRPGAKHGLRVSVAPTYAGRADRTSRSFWHLGNMGRTLRMSVDRGRLGAAD